MSIDRDFELREGDTVLVTLTVGFGNGSLSGDVMAETASGPARVSRKDCALNSTNIQVGDAVAYAPHSNLPHGLVLAVVDGQAWVRWDRGDEVESLRSLWRQKRPAPGWDPRMKAVEAAS